MAPDGGAPTTPSYHKALARIKTRAVLLRWHRWLGLAILPFVLLLVITGLLLEFSVASGLDRRTADVDWLKRWYGMAGEATAVSFTTGETWISSLDGTIYFNGEATVTGTSGLVGIAQAGGMLIAADDGAVYLFTPDGELIEKQALSLLPGSGAITGLSTGSPERAVITRDGVRFAADADGVVWSPYQGATQTPASASLPDGLAAKLRAHHQGPGPSWEQVLLDLHSGYLLGRLGPWLMDIVAVLIGFLALSGLYNAIRRP